MAFSPGDRVHIAALGKGVVREVRKGGRYVVEVKGRALMIDGARLSSVEERTPRNPRPDAAAPSERPVSGHAPSSLDLHGMTALDAVAAVDAFISDAILAGLGDVRIIHGRSGGTLKTAVHRRLRALPPIRHFRVDPANPGVTIVEL